MTKINWVIQSFNNDHNHVMVNLKSVSYIRCVKNMGAGMKSLIEKFEEESIPIEKVTSIFKIGDSTLSDSDH